MSFPGFVPDSTARHWRASLFLGFAVLPEWLTNARFQHTRLATVPQHAACRNVISPNIRVKRSSAAAHLGAAQPNR
jgi:hypothetical protein